MKTFFLLSRPRSFLAVLALLGLVEPASSINLLSNGDFDTVTDVATGNPTTAGGSFSNSSGEAFPWTALVTIGSWNAQGYGVVFMPGAADTTGANITGIGNIKLWGPNNGSANGLTATSPTGGKYLALDGFHQTGFFPANAAFISQTVSGLTVGSSYWLRFWWAGAQQDVSTGSTTDFLAVNFGSQTTNTSTLTNASKGFTGWQQAALLFTATATSQTLKITANGSPAAPPFILLDGINLSPAPEPGSALLVMTGGMCGLFLRRRRQPGSPAVRSK